MSLCPEFCDDLNTNLITSCQLHMFAQGQAGWMQMFHMQVGLHQVTIPWGTTATPRFQKKETKKEKKQKRSKRNKQGKKRKQKRKKKHPNKHPNINIPAVPPRVFQQTSKRLGDLIEDLSVGLQEATNNSLFQLRILGEQRSRNGVLIRSTELR